MKSYVCRHQFLLIFAFLFAIPVNAGSLQNQKNETIYFYNPETNINNFVSLKKSFDAYLAKFGDYQFQPFNNIDIFEKTILKQKNGVFLLSSWHYQSLRKKMNLQPLMVGVSKGLSTQQKVLSVRNTLINVEQLKGKTIASSGSAYYSRNLLKAMLGKKYEFLLSSIKLILVPKDIDALMAVGFGMADGALTGERSLENLQRINPNQYQLLTALLTSKNNYLALAVSHLPVNKNTIVLLDILEKMGINQEGEIRLRMLNLDAWRRLSTQEQLLIKQGHNGLLE